MTGWGTQAVEAEGAGRATHWEAGQMPTDGS